MRVTIRESGSEDDLSAILSLSKAFFTGYADHHEEFIDMDKLGDDYIPEILLRACTTEFA